MREREREREREMEALEIDKGKRRKMIQMWFCEIVDF